MAELGFRREGDRYLHPDTELYVEFPPGPLGIGGDLNVRPIELPVPSGAVLTLSATDAVRDRLAAFYHWDDRQSLEVAVEIARRNRVDVRLVGEWSRHEGHEQKFQEFLAKLKRSKHLGPRDGK
jgi:hypothetical protein